MSTIHDFINTLQQANVAVSLEGEKLKVGYDKPELPASILQGIKANREALIFLLKMNQSIQLPAAAPIPKVEEQDFYETSHAQKRLWYLQALNPGLNAYNIAGAFIIDGLTVDPKIIRKTFRTLLERHETLRTRFALINEEPRQCIEAVEEVKFEVGFTDLMPTDFDEDYLMAIAEEESIAPFDLTQAPLIRAKVYRLAAERHLLLVTIHHIIADGWSVGILTKELSHVYDAYSKGEPHELPPIQVQYKDFAQWEKRKLGSERGSQLKSFWMNLLKEELPVLKLPFSKLRPPRQTFNGRSIGLVLDAKTTSDLNRISNETHGSLFITLISVITLLLQKYTGQKDLILGTDSAGRQHKSLEDSIGFYLDALVLRYRVDPARTVLEMINYVRDVTLEIYDHQDYPLDILYDDLQIPRDPSRNPVFDVLVILQNFVSKEKESASNPAEEGMAITLLQGKMTTSIVDLEFTFTEQGDRLLLNLRYNTDLFDDEMMHQLGQHFVYCAEMLATNLHVPVAQVELLPPHQKTKLLSICSGKMVSYPVGSSFIALFSKQAKLTPDSVALVDDEDAGLTYTALDNASDQLAAFMRANLLLEAQPRVAVLLNRSRYSVISLLAIWKLRGIYVPFDPEAPAARTLQFIDHARISILLSDTATLHNLNARAEIPLQIVKLDETDWTISNLPAVRAPEAVASDAAYLMFTSGTTGKPKGVIVSQKAITDYTQTFAQYFAMTPADVVVHQSSLAFDTSLEEILPTLSTGGRLVICRQGGRDIDALIGRMMHHAATLLTATPQVLHEVNKRAGEVPTLRIAISGGDVLRAADIANLLHSAKVYNTYGPTEATICATFYSIENCEMPIMIGRPIPNHSVYVVDENLSLLPMGVTGEIVIGGAGLANGYDGNPEATNLHFIQAPLLGRVYRTGDMGRVGFDGNIEFLGRKDDAEVKIRGYRVALKEIETVLSQHPTVEHAVVNVVQDKEPYLVAYLKTDGQVQAQTLRSYLINRLPVYMVPRHFVAVPAFPLTPNGKIDLGRLPVPAARVAELTQTSANRFVEEKISEIWKAALQRESIGMHENFFEMGGHSLTGTRILNRIQREFGIEITFRELFEYPTIYELTAFISHKVEESYPA